MAIAHDSERRAPVGGPADLSTRQLLGVWLFIAGDAVVVISLLFTYLYLRALNTGHQWMPRGVHPASGVLAWLVVAVLAASAFAAWSAERAARRNASAVAASTLGAVLALVAGSLAGLEVSRVPRLLNAVTGVKQVAGSYASALLGVDISNVVHFVVLAFLGLGIALRARRGLVTRANPTHAWLVRVYWVWVLGATTVTTLVTTVIVANGH